MKFQHVLKPKIHMKILDWKPRCLPSLKDGRGKGGALTRGVAPGLVVGREHAHMAATDELSVIHSEQRVSGGQELRMENNLEYNE